MKTNQAKKAAKAFFQKKAVKITGGVLLSLSAVVAACNGVFAYVGLQEQKGVAVCEDWSPQNPFTEDAVQNLEIGNKDCKILCLTDIHIRNHGTFAACLGVNYILDGLSRLKLRHLINEVSPDLIIVGGDTVLTAWNDICTQQFCDFMDGFGIPWAPIFGNHDYEGRADKAKLAEIYEDSENCLFRSGPAGLGGMGNYIVNLTRDGQPVYSLFLLDNGQFRITDGQITNGGVNKNQIAWYEWAVSGMAETYGKEVPNMAFMHVPVPEYAELESGFAQGVRLEGTASAVENDGFFEVFRERGGTHLFAGHDHNNNFITEYRGVTLGYMTKSSYNCYFDFDVLGGTLLTLDQDNQVREEILSF